MKFLLICIDKERWKNKKFSDENNIKITDLMLLMEIL